MKYIGNKFRLLDFIDDALSKEKMPNNGTFIDIFTGTTNVAKHFKKNGYKIISNDFMTYSYVFQNAYIKTNKYPEFQNLKDLYKSKNPNSNKERLKIIIDYLNELKGSEGFVFENYSPGGSFNRQYFSSNNAKKIDSTRNTIQDWKDSNIINDEEFYILLSSLIDAADFVANMSGTYGAYLKIWRSMALKPFTMKPPELIDSIFTHDIYREDSNRLIKSISGDILYIDPPYTSRQYAPNFHVLETLAVWDYPILSGKTGLRPYSSQKSLYSQKANASKALIDLISNARVKYIIMSYSNEGLIPESEILKIIDDKCINVKIYKKIYRRFRTERDYEKRKYKVKDDRVIELLFLGRCK